MCTADEEFLVYRGGGKYKFKLRTGVKKDGTLMATDADILHDCGAYMETQFILLRFFGANMQALYKMQALRYTGKLIYTNNPPYFFHHGAGLVAMRFAFDGQLDLIARELGIDPVELRLKNAMEKGYMTPAKYFFCKLRPERVHTKICAKGRMEEKIRKAPSLPGHRHRLRDAALGRQGDV